MPVAWDPISGIGACQKMRKNEVEPVFTDVLKVLNAFSLKRCILEVDLEYPKDLLELHNDYPLVPDKTEIKREMFSNFQLKIFDQSL